MYWIYEKSKQVQKFKYLTVDGICGKEIRRQKGIGKIYFYRDFPSVQWPGDTSGGGLWNMRRSLCG